MATYDAAVINKFADLLYRRARTIIVVYTLLGAVIGYLAWQYSRGYPFVSVPILFQYGQFIFTAVFALVGFSIGQNRAFLLKLQAQTALCQLQIEANTRRP